MISWPTGNVAYLLEHSSLVDFLSGDVTHLQDAQGKGFEGWFLNQVRVMDVQTGEHSLCQGVALQPCDLGIHTNMHTWVLGFPQRYWSKIKWLLCQNTFVTTQKRKRTQFTGWESETYQTAKTCVYDPDEFRKTKVFHFDCTLLEWTQEGNTNNLELCGQL